MPKSISELLEGYNSFRNYSEIEISTLSQPMLLSAHCPNEATHTNRRHNFHTLHTENIRGAWVVPEVLRCIWSSLRRRLAVAGECNSMNYCLPLLVFFYHECIKLEIKSFESLLLLENLYELSHNVRKPHLGLERPPSKEQRIILSATLY